MNRLEAEVVANSYIEKMQREYPVDISINLEITEEHAIGFVFFYNTKDFWKTKDFSDSLVGNGPLLVLRDSGDLVVLPSYQSVKKSLTQYEHDQR